MRIDILSYQSRSADCLVELHMSRQMQRDLKGGKTSQDDMDKTVQQAVSAAIKSLGKGDGHQSVRVVIDQHWKKIQIIDSEGHHITQSIHAATKKPPKEDAAKADGDTSAATDQESVEETVKAENIVRIASTDHAKELTGIKPSFIKRGFRPVTSMEKIWKFLNNINRWLTRAAAKEQKSIGSFDFAVNFFSLETTRRKLMKEELPPSYLLERVLDFAVEKGISKEETKQIKQCASWAKEIESLQQKKRSTIQSKYGALAQDMHKKVHRLKKDQSLLIPCSTYISPGGESRSFDMRLMRITCTDVQEEKKGRKTSQTRQFKIEFVDNSAAKPLENVPGNKLTLDDVFRPLVDIQLPVSYTEDPSIKEKILRTMVNFVEKHPKLAAWVVMGNSPKEHRNLLISVMQHLNLTGALPISQLTKGAPTELSGDNFVANIFSPLIPEGSTADFGGPFQSAQTLLASTRPIDRLMPLLGDAKKQAKTEAQSLFEFFYLYEECLVDDPATMAVMNNGYKRVAQLYGELGITDKATNRMLSIIRERIAMAKQQLHTRKIDLNQKTQKGAFPDEFALPIPGAAHEGATSAASVKGHKKITALKTSPKEERPEAVTHATVETENRKLRAQIDLLTDAQIAVKKELTRTEKYSEAIESHCHRRKSSLQEFLVKTSNMIAKSQGFSEEQAENFQDRLKAILTTIETGENTPEVHETLKETYEQIFKEIDEALNTQLTNLATKLEAELKTNAMTITADFEKAWKTAPERILKECELQREKRADKKEAPETKQLSDIETLIQDIQSCCMPKVNGSFLDWYESHGMRESVWTAALKCGDDLKAMKTELENLYTSLVGFRSWVDYQRSERKDLNELIYHFFECTKDPFIRDYHTNKNSIQSDKRQAVENQTELQAHTEYLFQTPREYLKNKTEKSTRTLQTKINELHRNDTITNELLKEASQILNNAQDELQQRIQDDARPLSDLFTTTHLQSLKTLLQTPMDDYKSAISRPSQPGLDAIKERIALCERGFAGTLSNEERLLLRHELDVIFSELPCSFLAIEMGTWPVDKEPEQQAWSKQLQTLHRLVNKAYSGDDAKLPSAVLQRTLCSAMIFKNMPPELEESKPLAVRAKHLEAVEEANHKFQDAANDLSCIDLIFPNPEHQRQKADVLTTLKTLRQETDYRAELNRFRDPGKVDKVNVSPVPNNYRPKQGKYAHDLYDYRSHQLMHGYAHTNEYETSILYLSQANVGLDANECYRLLSTNSDEPGVGLQELLLQSCDPDGMHNLNNTRDNLHTGLRRIIEYRMLNKNHLAEFVKDPERVKSTLHALDEAIESAKTSMPHAYITLMEIKATLLVYIRDQHRVDDNPAKENPLTEQLSDMIVDLSVALKQKHFVTAQVQLHTALLNIAAKSITSQSYSSISRDMLPLLLDSWIAYSTGKLRMGYVDRTEKAAINELFYGHLLPQWKLFDEAQRCEILREVLQARNPSADLEQVVFKRVGEVYKFTLDDQSAYINVIDGTLAKGGIVQNVGDAGLEGALWNNFPLRSEGREPIGQQNVGKEVIEFKVKGLGDTLFQAKHTPGGPLYSVRMQGLDGQWRWYQYVSMKDAAYTQWAKGEQAKKEEGDEQKPGLLKKLKNKVETLRAPIRNLTEELATRTPHSKEEKTVPKEILEQGVWLNRQKPQRGIVLGDAGELQHRVMFSQKRVRKGKEIRHKARITRITAASGDSQPLKLVNNPESSLYNKLCGLTPPENISLWANKKGVIQKIELLDPQMTFKRDPVTDRLMSSELTGFFIDSDQSLPVGDFRHDWENYLIVKNEASEQRVLMRQSDLAPTGFLTRKGIEISLARGTAAHPAEGGFIDVELKSHPEKGPVLNATTHRANMYLGLAAMASDNFGRAAQYLRASAHSAPFTAAEHPLAKAIFDYKKGITETIGMRADADDDIGEGLGPLKGVVNFVDSMQKYDPQAPNIAATKLIALAAMLEQNIADSESIKELLPSPDVVKAWITLALLPAGSDIRLYTPDAAARLTPQELTKIASHYPGIADAQSRVAALLPSTMVTEKESAEKEALEPPILPMEEVSLIQEINIGDLQKHLADVQSRKNAKRSFPCRLVASEQTTKREKVMAFYGGKYVLRHFAEIYKKIDSKDMSDAAKHAQNQDELAKLIRQFSLFKDITESRRDAIDFILRMARVKYHAKPGGLVAKAGGIQQLAAEKAIDNHFEALKQSRTETKKQIAKILDTPFGEDTDVLQLTYETRELLSLDEFKKLSDLWKKITDMKWDHETLPDKDNKEVLAKAMGADYYKKLSALQTILRKAMDKQDVSNRSVLSKKPEAIKQVLLKSSKRGLPLYEKSEVAALRDWKEGDNPVEAMKKIRVNTDYTLWDHLEDPGNNPIIGSVMEAIANVLEIAPPEITKNVMLTLPKFVRKKWKPDDLVRLNEGLTDLERQVAWAHHTRVPTRFPGKGKGIHKAMIMAAYINSHSTIKYEPPELPPEEAPAPVDLPEADTAPFLDKLTENQRAQFAPFAEDKQALELISSPAFNALTNPWEVFIDVMTEVAIPVPADIPTAIQALTEAIAKEEPKPVAEKGTVKMLEEGKPIIAVGERVKLASTDKEALEDALKAITTLQAKQQEVVNLLRRDILALANRLPENPAAHSAEELRRLAGRAQEIEIETVFLAYARNDMEEALPRLNHSLTPEDVEKLREMVTGHHIQATKLQVINRQATCIERVAELRTRFNRKVDPAVLEELNNLEDSEAFFVKLETDGDYQKQYFDDKSYTSMQFADDLRDYLSQLKAGETKRVVELRTRFNQKVDPAVLAELKHLVDSEAFFVKLETDDDYQTQYFDGKSYTSMQFADDLRDYLSQLKAVETTGQTERYYDLSLDHEHTRAALAYEYTLGVVFRSHQIKEFTNRVGTPDIVSWLGTAFGKTFMAPGLARMMATGTNLVCIVDTKDLIPTTSRTRDSDSRAIYGQAAYRFDFTRDVDRNIESLQEMKYHLLDAVHNKGYIVTSKEALGSLVLQLYNWQRLENDTPGSHAEQIALAQDLVKIFRERGVALGDEIHLILNVIEALDYSEGSRESLATFAEYYETMSTIYRTLYPYEMTEDAAASSEIANKLHIAENRQAQVNEVTLREAMVQLAELIVKQSIDPSFKPKDELHALIWSLIEEKNISAEVLVTFLTLQEPEEGQKLALEKVPPEIQNLPEKEKRRIAALKENLGATFEKIVKKVADEDFGVSPQNGLSICPYDKGRPEAQKEFDDVFQTIQTHYMWYTINGIPQEGLKTLLASWQDQVEKELALYGGKVDECPTNKKYRKVFGDKAPELITLDAATIGKMAQEAKDDPARQHRFLQDVVFPQTYIYPFKLGFNSMDVVSMFHKFGGYSGTVQTRGGWNRAITNKDDPTVDQAATANFQAVYHNPKNQKQYTLPNLESADMKAIAAKKGQRIPPLSSQLKTGKIPLKNFRAIIDIGGLFKDLGYKEMAQDILDQFEPEELEAVLIYNDQSERMILRRGSHTLEPFTNAKAIPPAYDMRFTVYRQPQITGADIPQAQHAKALVTMSEKTRWGDFEQGVGRLRKNKEGQTYSVMYRQSLKDTIDEDHRIAKEKAGNNPDDPKLQAMVNHTSKLLLTNLAAKREALENDNTEVATAQKTWLDAAISAQGTHKEEIIDIRALTQTLERNEIKLRRYYAAVSEMENILKQTVRELLCTDDWKTAFDLFGDMIFEASQKTPEQLLEIKVPTKPEVVLKRIRNKLTGRIDKAMETNPMESLNEAKKKIKDYKFPSSEELPDFVLGTHGDSTKNVEVAKEVEVDTDINKIDLAENLTSSIHCFPKLDWIKWTPIKLTNMLLDPGSYGPEAEDRTIVSVAENASGLLIHLTWSEKTSQKLADRLPLQQMFEGISVTRNMLQRRTVEDTIAAESLLSRGQKDARSIAEISIIQEGTRRFHNLLLDLNDHNVFEKAMARAKTILTPEFRKKVQDLIDSNPDLKKQTLDKLDGRDLPNNDRGFLLSLLGGDISLEQLSSLSLRLIVDNRYTGSCGALGITDWDAEANDLARETHVRAKFLSGEKVLKAKEAELFEAIVTQSWLKGVLPPGVIGIVDFELMKRQLRSHSVPPGEITRLLKEKSDAGFVDYSEIEDTQKIATLLFDLTRLYSQAVNANNSSPEDVNGYPFVKVLVKIMEKLNIATKETPLESHNDEVFLS